MKIEIYFEKIDNFVNNSFFQNLIMFIYVRIFSIFDIFKLIFFPNLLIFTKFQKFYWHAFIILTKYSSFYKILQFWQNLIIFETWLFQICSIIHSHDSVYVCESHIDSTCKLARNYLRIGFNVLGILIGKTIFRARANKLPLWNIEVVPKLNSPAPRRTGPQDREGRVPKVRMR